eukprot:15453679-Alexandrium_andersonii.AAC.1
MVHVKRVAPALRWLRAFFDDARGPFARTRHVHARNRPAAWTIATDASTWGMGSILSTPRRPV